MWLYKNGLIKSFSDWWLNFQQFSAGFNFEIVGHGYKSFNNNNKPCAEFLCRICAFYWNILVVICPRLSFISNFCKRYNCIVLFCHFLECIVIWVDRVLKYTYKYFVQLWFKYKYIDSNTYTDTFNQIYSGLGCWVGMLSTVLWLETPYKAKKEFQD